MILSLTASDYLCAFLLAPIDTPYNQLPTPSISLVVHWPFLFHIQLLLTYHSNYSVYMPNKTIVPLAFMPGTIWPVWFSTRDSKVEKQLNINAELLPDSGEVSPVRHPRCFSTLKSLCRISYTNLQYNLSVYQIISSYFINRQCTTHVDRSCYFRGKIV